MVSSGSCIHLCWGIHFLPCGKVARFLSHVPLFTLSRSHWSTTDPFLTTSVTRISLRLSSGLDFHFVQDTDGLDSLTESGNNQTVFSSFLSGKCKMDLALSAAGDVVSISSTSSSHRSQSPSSSPYSEFQSSSPSLTTMVTLGEVQKTDRVRSRSQVPLLMLLHMTFSSEGDLAVPSGELFMLSSFHSWTLRVPLLMLLHILFSIEGDLSVRS